MKKQFCLLFTICCLLSVQSSFAQMFPERSHIRDGNKAYQTENWEEALMGYDKAMVANPASWEAAINMGSTLYRMGQYAQADSLYSKLTQHPLLTPQQRARVFYNLGNDQFQSKQYDKAIESYKNSLRLNPEDMEAKFNLAYAKKMLENQQDQQQDNKDNQDQQDNKDQNQQNNQEDNQEQNNEQNQDQQNQNSQQSQQSISREDAEKLLDAMQQQEDNTAERVKAEQAEKTAGQRGKNW